MNKELESLLKKKDIETKEGFYQVNIGKWLDDTLQILNKVGDNNV